MLLGGRGMGKTRTGAETIRAWVEESPTPLRIALVGQNSGDVRDVMIQGESGIIAISPPWNRPSYIPGRRLLLWPNGSYALLFSGDTPNQLRGPQFHKAWVDELAKFQYPDETWDNLEFGLRLGDNPQVVVTTTPRPLPIIKKMLEDDMTVVTRGSSYENMSNLPASFIARVIKKYEGTRVGRQEVHAEVLTDMPGALWTYTLIERQRVMHVPDMVRIVVSVDPAASSSEEAAETGLVVCGKDINGFGYVLRDMSGHYTPDGWAQAAIDLYYEFGADRVVAEVNNGGEMVETILRTKDRNVSYKDVHASRGKMRRAEPVAALYEQGKVWHHGQFAAMEDQMATYNPDAIMTEAERRRQNALSPDRMDAMVWGITELLLADRRGSLDASGWVGVRR
jgi:phage terminase large subunit-like protein